MTCGAEFVCCVNDLLSGRFVVSKILCVDDFVCGWFVVGKVCCWDDLFCGKFVIGMSAFGFFYTFSCELFVIFRSHNTPSHHLDQNVHIHYSAR